MTPTKILYQLSLLLISTTTILAGKNLYEFKFHYEEELSHYMKKDNQLGAEHSEQITFSTTFNYDEKTISLAKLHEIATKSLVKETTSYYFFWKKIPSYTVKILLPSWWVKQEYEIQPSSATLLEGYIFDPDHPKEEASALIIDRIAGRGVKIAFYEVEYNDFKLLPITTLDKHQLTEYGRTEEKKPLQNYLFDIDAIVDGANHPITDEVTGKKFYPFVIVRGQDSEHYYKVSIGITVFSFIAAIILATFLLTRKFLRRSSKKQRPLENLVPQWKRIGE